MAAQSLSGDRTEDMFLWNFIKKYIQTVNSQVKCNRTNKGVLQRKQGCRMGLGALCGSHFCFSHPFQTLVLN